MLIILRCNVDLRRLVPIGVLGGLLLGAAACGPSDSDFVEFGTFQSPDRNHSIVVEMAPKNSLAFAPEVIRLYLAGQDTSKRYLLTTTTLANDGGRITGENIVAEWIDSNTLRLCLSGAEQDDETYIIDVVTAAFSIESANCAD